MGNPATTASTAATPETSTPVAEKSAKLVTVKVKGQPICEDGEHYTKDQTFQTTRERAKALCHLVDIEG